MRFVALLRRPFPVLCWLLKRASFCVSSLLREAFKNYLLFYAGNVFFRGYDGVVVYGYAVDSGADEEFCEVGQQLVLVM